MQQLIFEAAWEQAISEQDRRFITELFAAQDHSKGEGLKSSYVRHVMNHRGHLLYTVMLHNYQDRAYSFTDKTVTLQDRVGYSIMDTFTIPEKIPPHTSMPWTFIFSSPTVEMGYGKEVSFLL